MHYDIIYMKNNVIGEIVYQYNSCTHPEMLRGSHSSFEIHFLTSSSLVVVACYNFLADNPDDSEGSKQYNMMS